MGIFFISMNENDYVNKEIIWFPSPMGIFFISIWGILSVEMQKASFRPLWGSFLFL